MPDPADSSRATATRGRAVRPERVVWIFGYGSLLRRPPHGVPHLAPPRPALLHGGRRRWGVAMDNTRVVPGYKVYVDPATGRRPPVAVTFLDVVPQPDGSVNGLVFAFPATLLPALDRRERNYERHDVSDRVDVEVGARVWAYTGRGVARERYRDARRRGAAVVSREYHERVLADFASFGPEMLRAFHATTDSPEVPLRDLRRVDVPADGGADPQRAAVEGTV